MHIGDGCETKTFLKQESGVESFEAKPGVRGKTGVTSWSPCPQPNSVKPFYRCWGFMASAWCAWSSVWRISLRLQPERLKKFPLVLRCLEFFATSRAETTNLSGVPQHRQHCFYEAMFVDATLSGLKYNDVPRNWRFSKGAVHTSLKGENLQMPTVEHHPY